MGSQPGALSVRSRPITGALVGCVGASALAAVVAGFVGGFRGTGSVAIVSVVVLAYFVSGQIVESLALGFADVTGLAIVLASYAVRVGLLGIVLWWAVSHPGLTGWTRPVWVVVGALASVIGWLAGLVTGHARSRVAIYDQPYRAPAGWDE
ncbi:hypothetical protein GCM10009785_06480 [Brooklawnia cerclae]|uniref:ATP synthase protein I n=1 Tax=Brooklawnia cerclae TaxID=349934 RepID=A0ABX0SEW0_9ACTN|nr:hypothetical protein [Brooklawnia cerclae]NIH56429.1 hypothetical protein [Brooklawnia cerclae]